MLARRARGTDDVEEAAAWGGLAQALADHGPGQHADALPAETYTPPPSVRNEDMGKALDQTMAATNKAGLFYYWSNQVSALDKATGQDLKLMRPPSKTGSAKDAQLWYKASMYWSGSAKSKNAAEVAKFVSFLSSNIEAGKVMGSSLK